MPDYFASARGADKSLACPYLCIIMLLLLCPDAGQHIKELCKNINFAMEAKSKKLNCLSSC